MARPSGGAHAQRRGKVSLVRADTSESLASHESELVRELGETGSSVLGFLRRAQFEVASIERGRGPTGEAPWTFLVRPSADVVQAFALAPELLVLLMPARRARALDIEIAERALSRGPRIDRSLVVAFTRDANASQALARVVRGTRREYVFVEIERARAVQEPQPWMRALLRTQLVASDLFAPGPPVVGWDFFGREDELVRLRRHIMAGEPVGLYGLRKVGKTSLVLRELSRLSAETRRARESGLEEHGHLCAHLDMQRLGPMEQNIFGFMRGLIKALFEGAERSAISSEELKFDASWRDAKALRRASDTRVVEVGTEMLECGIEWARRRGTSRSVVLFVDEYERLFDRELFPLRDSRQILEHLRGLVQTYPGAFDFIIAGLSRRYASVSTMGKHQNPLFDFVADFPLAGMRRDELRSLLREIGARAGLTFETGAIEEIWAQTGGHPWLAREYGRLIDRSLDSSPRVDGAVVERGHVRELLARYAVEVETTMEEFLRAASSVDETCVDVLGELAATSMSSLAPLSDATVEHLRRLGLIEQQDDGRWHVGIGIFGAWLLRNVPRPTMERVG